MSAGFVSPRHDRPIPFQLVVEQAALIEEADGSHWCEDCGAILDELRLCSSCIPNSQRNPHERTDGT